MARVRFTVQGMKECGPGPAEIVRALDEHEFGQPEFDPAWGIFSVEIDPARNTFAGVRRAVAALGKRHGLVYLAVIMSP